MSTISYEARYAQPEFEFRQAHISLFTITLRPAHLVAS